MHLNEEKQQYFFVDKAAVPISGKVVFSGPAQNAGKCAIENATVIAIDARSDKAITNTTTNGTGVFNLAVAKQTKLRLKVEYYNHTFDATSTLPFDGLDDLVSTGEGNGFTVTEAIKGLEFEDTTKSKITITSAVTECAFKIGPYDLQLTVPGCPAADTYKVSSDNRESFTVEVPAHVYDFALSEFDGYGSSEDPNYVDGRTIKERFDYMFPSATRKMNVTALGSHENVHFTFHPDVELKMEVDDGLFAPETFVNAECSKGLDSTEDPPFDFAIEGNDYASLRFSFRQNYIDSNFCEILPDGFTLKITSNLNKEEDPCSSNNDGCQVNVTTEESQVRASSSSTSTSFNSYAMHAN